MFQTIKYGSITFFSVVLLQSLAFSQPEEPRQPTKQQAVRTFGNNRFFIFRSGTLNPRESYSYKDVLEEIQFNSTHPNSDNLMKLYRYGLRQKTLRTLTLIILADSTFLTNARADLPQALYNRLWEYQLYESEERYIRQIALGVQQAFNDYSHQKRELNAAVFDWENELKFLENENKRPDGSLKPIDWVNLGRSFEVILSQSLETEMLYLLSESGDTPYHERPWRTLVTTAIRNLIYAFVIAARPPEHPLSPKIDQFLKNEWSPLLSPDWLDRVEIPPYVILDSPGLSEQTMEQWIAHAQALHNYFLPNIELKPYYIARLLAEPLSKLTFSPFLEEQFELFLSSDTLNEAIRSYETSLSALQKRANQENSAFIPKDALDPRLMAELNAAWKFETQHDLQTWEKISTLFRLKEFRSREPRLSDWSHDESHKEALEELVLGELKLKYEKESPVLFHPLKGNGSKPLYKLLATADRLQARMLFHEALQESYQEAIQLLKNENALPNEEILKQDSAFIRDIENHFPNFTGVQSEWLADLIQKGFFEKFHDRYIQSTLSNGFWPFLAYLGLRLFSKRIAWIGSITGFLEKQSLYTAASWSINVSFAEAFLRDFKIMAIDCPRAERAVREALILSYGSGSNVFTRTAYDVRLQWAKDARTQFFVYDIMALIIFGKLHRYAESKLITKGMAELSI